MIFSPSFAKYTFAIKTRDKYSSFLYQIRKLFSLKEADNCWYFHQPISVLGKRNDGLYNYALSGKLVSIDNINDTIVLECSSGNKYKLHIKINEFEDKGWVIIQAGISTKAEKPKDFPFTFYIPDISKSFEHDPYYEDNQLYVAVWTEKRELSEIYKQIKNSPSEPVNKIETPIRPLLRY